MTTTEAADLARKLNGSDYSAERQWNAREREAKEARDRGER